MKSRSYDPTAAGPLADAYADLYGAMAALTALRVVEVHGGPGKLIDLAPIEPILAMLGPKAAEYRLRGRTAQRRGSRCDIQAPRDVYRTSDGRYVALSTGTQGMAERLLRAIGRPELVHPYVEDRELFVELPDGQGGGPPMHNIVPRLSATPGAFRQPAPTLGEHNVEILEALGCTPEAIRALIEAGVIGSVTKEPQRGGLP